MKTIAWIIFCYALLVLLGGVMGHIKAASNASLLAGLFCGAGLFLCAGLTFQGKRYGIFLALFSILLLAGFFTFRLIKTGAFMPAGLMTSVSFFILIILALKTRRVLQARP